MKGKLLHHKKTEDDDLPLGCKIETFIYDHRDAIGGAYLDVFIDDEPWINFEYKNLDGEIDAIKQARLYHR